VFIGESGLGKTTFINTLFTTTIKEHKNQNKRHAKQTDKTVEIEITKAGEYCKSIDLEYFEGFIANSSGWSMEWIVVRL
jgi:cell division control protein 12